MFEEYWCESLHSTDYRIIDKAVACLIGWMSFEWGLRIGNLTKTSSDKKQTNIRRELESSEHSLRKGSVVELDQHAIRAKEVRLDVTENGGARTMTAFQYSRCHHHFVLVHAITLAFVSSKTNQKGDRQVTFRLESSSAGHRILLEMLRTFIIFAQYDKEDDLLFSRVESKRLRGSLSSPLPALPGSDRRRYRQSDANSLIKECAEDFDLDPKKFSSKSFKSGGISTVKLNNDELGMTDQQIAHQFDHKSVSANRMYQRSALVEDSVKGPLRFVGSGKAFGHRNLEIMESITSGTAKPQPWR